ncbi:hypothetical protein GGS26DRAFT_341429 [Hypomontagnella submonticulosa]|nr:hypothetical protein GGS26DRAFT_341429 [Hypomontagnella submonticulosa]
MAPVNSLIVGDQNDPDSGILKGEWAWVRQMASSLRESDQVVLKFPATNFSASFSSASVSAGQHESRPRGGGSARRTGPGPGSGLSAGPSTGIKSINNGSGSRNKTPCGNCGIIGHRARDCIKVGESGWMDFACPKCNQSGHYYDQCRCRQKSEDLDYLFWYRQNKGPIKSCFNIGELLQKAIAEDGEVLHRLKQCNGVPYTPKYARQIQRDLGWIGWKYHFEGRPDEEAATRNPEPQFFGLTIEQLATALDRPGWRRGDNDVDHGKDGPTPTLPVNLYERNRAASQEYRRGERYGSIRRSIELPQGSNQLSHSTPREPREKNPNTALIPLGPKAGAKVGYKAGYGGPTALVWRKRTNEEEEYSQAKRQKIQVCSNCGEMNHSQHYCTKQCGACGKQGHVLHACSKKEEACPCVSHPRHLRAECTQLCQYCPYMKTVKNLRDVKHLSLDCPEICHYCLKTDHTTRSCPRFMGPDGQRDPRKPCAQCPRQFHFATDCIANICPVFGCDDPYNCKKHCRNCGCEASENAALSAAGLPKHTCQWEKRWAFEIIGGLCVRRVDLMCPKDAVHKRVKAKDLLPIRAQVVADEIESGIVHMEPWVECFECHECSDKMAPVNSPKDRQGI